MAAKDYYALLGVGRDADDAALKKAYRTLARQHHPDKNPGDRHAEERFKEISEAYAVLSDPDKRAQYDRFGTVSGLGGPGDAGFGTIFEDLFEGFFGGGGGGPKVAVAVLLGEEGLGFERLAEATDLLIGCHRQRVGVRDQVVVAHDTSKYSRRPGNWLPRSRASRARGARQCENEGVRRPFRGPRC